MTSARHQLESSALGVLTAGRCHLMLAARIKKSLISRHMRSLCRSASRMPSFNADCKCGFWTCTSHSLWNVPCICMHSGFQVAVVVPTTRHLFCVSSRPVLHLRWFSWIDWMFQDLVVEELWITCHNQRQWFLALYRGTVQYKSSKSEGFTMAFLLQYLLVVMMQQFASCEAVLAAWRNQMWRDTNLAWASKLMIKHQLKSAPTSAESWMCCWRHSHCMWCVVIPVDERVLTW